MSDTIKKNVGPDATTFSSQQDSVNHPTPPHSQQNYLISFFASGIGFLADAYDFFVIDSVFDLIKNTAAIPPNDANQNMVMTATLVGAVIGQIGFGLGADLIGRRQMFLITSALVTLGSVGSALVGFQYQTVTHSFTIYHQLMLFRFILGVGIGGEYPLSASVSTESSSTSTPSPLRNDQNKDKHFFDVGHHQGHWLWFLREKPNSLAAVFSLQGIGLLLSSLVIMAFLSLQFPLEVTWRLCLGLGALPSAIAFYFRWKMHESKEFKTAARRFVSHRDSSTSSHSSRGSVATTITATEPSRLADKPYFLDISPNGIEKNETLQLNDESKVDDKNRLNNPSLEFHLPEKKKHLDMEKNSETMATPPKKLSRFLRCKRHYKKSSKLLYSFRYALLGSSLSWFLIDVTLYGVASYKTDLSKMLLRQSESSVTPLFPNLSLNSFNTTSAPLPGTNQMNWFENQDGQESIRSLVFRRTRIGFFFTLLGLPGYIVSIFCIHKIHLKTLQLMGFAGVASIFFLMSLLHLTRVNTLSFDIILLGLTFFFSNFGPNTTTYILPTQLFPTIIRATCHGFSAAMGKAGAVFGTILVKVVETNFGLFWLFFSCALVSLLGVVVTYFLVEFPHDSDDDAQQSDGSPAFNNNKSIV